MLVFFPSIRVYAFELNVTVMTDKQMYCLGEIVHINGDFTVNGEPIPDGLVALQVANPSGYPIMFRTLKTGNASFPDPEMQVTAAFLCNEQGKPKHAFRLGDSVYFNITILNVGITQPVGIFAVVQDQNLRPLGTAFAEYSHVPHNRTFSQILSMIPTVIPQWATIGNATLYVNLFTQWAAAGGHPYCPERSVTFEIVDSQQSASFGETETTEVIDTNGTYSSAFRIPPMSPLGNYTAYASASKWELQALDNVTYKVILTRDVAISSVAPSKSVVGTTYPVSISVTVENQGSLAETVAVTVYYDANTIGTQGATLNAGTLRALEFTWNTTGVPKGTYTISANVSVVPGETDLADNNYIDGVVTVTIAGDVDGDNDVDSMDLFTLAAVYGTKTGDPLYNSECDFDDDGDIDSMDLFTLAANYGRAV